MEGERRVAGEERTGREPSGAQRSRGHRRPSGRLRQAVVQTLLAGLFQHLSLSHFIPPDSELSCVTHRTCFLVDPAACVSDAGREESQQCPVVTCPSSWTLVSWTRSSRSVAGEGTCALQSSMSAWVSPRPREAPGAGHMQSTQPCSSPLHTEMGRAQGQQGHRNKARGWDALRPGWHLMTPLIMRALQRSPAGGGNWAGSPANPRDRDNEN